MIFPSTRFYKGIIPQPFISSIDRLCPFLRENPALVLDGLFSHSMFIFKNASCVSETIKNKHKNISPTEQKQKKHIPHKKPLTESSKRPAEDSYEIPQRTEFQPSLELLSVPLPAPQSTNHKACFPDATHKPRS